MDFSIYEKMAKVEQDHWWYSGRRAIACRIFQKLKLPPEAKILEAGCGTGGNLNLLSEFGKVYAFECDPIARSVGFKKSNIQIFNGELPNNIPFDDNMFDLIVLFDVIEHVNEDKLALLNLVRKLKIGGHLLITVPAHQWLWSSSDNQNYHKRRYSKKMVKDMLQKSKLKIIQVTYFNTVLFPLIVAMVFIEKITNVLFNRQPKLPIGLLIIPPKTINNFLKKTLFLEGWFLNKFSLPMGVSILALVQKDEGVL